jgi:hypothetical protein
VSRREVIRKIVVKYAVLIWHRPPLWSSGQEFLATDPKVRVRFPALPDFVKSSGSGTGPISLMSTTEELLERENSGSGLEIRDYGRGGSAALTTRHPQKLALSSPTSGGPLGRYRSLADSGQGFFSLYYIGCSLIEVSSCKVPSRVGFSPSLVKKETDPVSEALCFLVIQNSGRWTKSTNPAIVRVPMGPGVSHWKKTTLIGAFRTDAGHDLKEQR